jgi:hypothetical protein
MTSINTSISNYLTCAGFANPVSDQSSATSDLLSIYDVPSVSGATLLQSAGTLPTCASSPEGIWNNPYTDGSFVDFWFEYKAHLRAGYISEFTFYNVLIKNIYDDIADNSYLDSNGGAFEDSQFFKNIIYKLHNDISPVIRANMMDSEGNINQYSLGNEVSQVEVDLSYVYATE